MSNKDLDHICAFIKHSKARQLQCQININNGNYN